MCSPIKRNCRGRFASKYGHGEEVRPSQMPEATLNAQEVRPYHRIAGFFASPGNQADIGKNLDFEAGFSP